MQTKRKSVSRSVSVPNLQNSKHQTLSLQFTASLDPYRLGNVWSAQAGDLSNLIHPGKPNQILAGKVSLKIPLIQHISSYTRYIASSDIFTSLKFKTCLQSYHWIGSRDFFRTWFWDSILVCWSLANGFPKHLKKTGYEQVEQTLKTRGVFRNSSSWASKSTRSPCPRRPLGAAWRRLAPGIKWSSHWHHWNMMKHFTD